MFKRILIANRGEIALRVQRTCRELGIETVAVYSEPDRNLLHVRQADRAVHLGDGPATESYQKIEKVTGVSQKSLILQMHVLTPVSHLLSRRVML